MSCPSPSPPGVPVSCHSSAPELVRLRCVVYRTLCLFGRGNSASLVARPAHVDHALRRDELCKLKVKDFKRERRGRGAFEGVQQMRQNAVVPLVPAASGLILDYLEAAGHSGDEKNPRPVNAASAGRSRPLGFVTAAIGPRLLSRHGSPLK